MIGGIFARHQAARRRNAFKLELHLNFDATVSIRVTIKCYVVDSASSSRGGRYNRALSKSNIICHVAGVIVCLNTSCYMTMVNINLGLFPIYYGVLGKTSKQSAGEWRSRYLMLRPEMYINTGRNEGKLTQYRSTQTCPTRS